MFPELERYPVFAYDTETTGLNWAGGDRVFGFSLSLPDGRDFYYDIRQTPDAWEWLKSAVSKLRPDRNRIVCHNTSFDYHFSRASGIQLPLECLDDTVIRACLLDEHHFSYELDHLGERILKRRKVDIVPVLAEVFGGRKTRNVQMPNLQRAAPEIVAPYAKGDTRLTLDLWQWQEKEIHRQDPIGPRPVSNIIRFERKLMPYFIKAEERGIRVDVDAAARAQISLTEQIKPLQKKLDDICGFAVNVNSNTGKNAHIPKVFQPKRGKDGEWYANNGERLGKTPSGNASLSKEVLYDLKHPAAKLIVELRGLLRLRDTFLGKHVLEHEVNGRVYPRINQNKGEDGGTGTGRLSYVDPAMQQIPARDKVKSAVIRPIFLPELGHRWVDCDKSSFEVRVFAHLSNPPSLVREYRKNPNLDGHQYVADETGLPRNMPPEGGANAKQLNLSMIFSQGDGATAEKMGLPWTWETFLPRGSADRPENYVTFKKPGPEAKEIIERYHRRFPGIREFAQDAKQKALRRGFVVTALGRRLRFPRGFKAYKASGLLIQATAADWNKQNWMIISDAMGSDGELLLNIHDGYGLSIEEGKEHEVATRVKKAVESAERSRVPLVLEVQPPGDNWWESYSQEVWMK